MKIIQSYKAKQVMEGAGVPVRRVFSQGETKAFDPFLLLDYLVVPPNTQTPGFPWHPHRGIETITYILKGEARHEDSIGNKGPIATGELQWMSAGGGIYHQEMLGECEEGVQGFQFWLNLPAKDKMNPPEYLYIRQGEMPIVSLSEAEVRVISGTYAGVRGPINKDNLGVSMLHIGLKAGERFELTRDEQKQGFIFVFEGSGTLDSQVLENETGYTLGAGQGTVLAGEEGLAFIYAEGKPLVEPIAWMGPVVMNTDEELKQAFYELRKGTFAKY